MAFSPNQVLVFLLRQRRLDSLGRERQFADALAGGGSKGIGDRRRGWTLRSFSRAERALVWPIDQHSFDFRRLRHREDRISLPVTRQDAVLIETYLLVQRP